MLPAGKKKVLGAGRKEERSRQGGSERVGDLAAQGEARGEAGAQVLLSPALRVRGTRGQRAEGPNLTGGAPKRCRREDTCAGMRDLLEGLVRKGRWAALGLTASRTDGCRDGGGGLRDGVCKAEGLVAFQEGGLDPACVFGVGVGVLSTPLE